MEQAKTVRPFVWAFVAITTLAQPTTANVLNNGDFVRFHNLMGEFIQILRDLINIKGGMTSGSNVAWDCLNEMYVTFDTIHSNLELVESLMSIAPVMIDKVDERVVLDQLAEAAIHSLNGIDIARQRINQLVGRCSWNSVAVVKGQTILNFFEQAASLTRSIRKRIE